MGDDDDDHQPRGKKLAQAEPINNLGANQVQDDYHQHCQLIDTIASLPEDQCLCNSELCKQVVLSRELDNILSVFECKIDKIWPTITQRTQAEIPGYLKILAEYKTERHCGFAWPPNSVAYRCRTCSKTPTMALCTDCFRNGDHDGHDYNMFKSRIGGACDCGFSIMKESGNCNRHGKNAIAKRSNEQLPEHLICIPKRSMPRLIHRLAMQFRRNHFDLTGDTDIYIDILTQIATSSAMLRDLMVDALISDQSYSSQIEQLSNHQDSETIRVVNGGLKKLKSEMKGLKPFKLPWGSTTKSIKAFSDDLIINCFLDELIFWTVVGEFPQKLVCFLLSFLMDDKYKESLARTFVNHYPRIVMVLAGVKNEPRRHLRDSYEQLSRRILQVSVQIYNDVKLTKKLCEEEHTLHALIYCIRVAIEGSPSDELSGVLKFNPLCLSDGSAPRMVCCDNLLIRDRHLGSFTEDLNAILDFEHEAIRLISDRDLLNTWLEMLTYFQTIAACKRELGEHTPYETSPHISVFSIESEFCLSPLWFILSHMKVGFVKYSQALIEAIHVNLAVWFYNMRIGPNSLLDPYYMSFHIPLHRMFAATLRHMIFNQSALDETIYNFLSDNQLILGTKYSYKTASGTPITITMNDFFKILLLHPLQALTLYHETRSSMWTRNGLSVINQAVTYVHCSFCHSTVDLDMFLLKYCASKLNPNNFIKILMSRFHAWKWLSFKSNSIMSNASNGLRHFNIRPEQIIQMVESSLVTLIQLLTLSLHCNISEREQTKEEMVAIISVADRSYSLLIDMLPDKSAPESKNMDDFFKSLLDETTIYKPAQHGVGGNLQQGCYTLKQKIWDEEYNPIHVLYRFYQKKDYQMSLERFFQHSKLTGKLDKRYHSSTLWPPLRIPRNIGNFGQLDLSPVIECPTLVGLIFSIIFKNLYIVDISDAIVAYAIHLLELALRKSLEKKQKVDQMKAHSSRHIKELNNSFVGEVLYRELASSPAYFGSKGEAFIKGSTLYALPNKYKREPSELNNSKLFPTVKHALDLSFDTTWFPYKSVVDNCLVHIENVHSLPWKDFEMMLKTTEESNELSRQSQQAGMSTGGSYDCTMSLDDHDDGKVVDDDEIDADDVDDDEDDYDDEDEDDEEVEDDGDEEDIQNFVGQLNLRPSSDAFSRLALRQAQLPNQSDSQVAVGAQNRPASSELFEHYLRNRNLTHALAILNNNPVTTVHHEDALRPEQRRATHDRATNTLADLWASSDSNGDESTPIPQNVSQALPLANPTPGGEMTNPAIAPNLTQFQLTNTPQGDGTSTTNNLPVVLGTDSRELNQQTTAPIISEPSMNVENIDDVEMITVVYGPNVNSTGPLQSVTNNDNSNQADARVHNSIARAPSSPSASSQTDIGGQPASNTPTDIIVSVNLASSGDHTYSAVEATSMEVESLPETQYGALSLVPVHQHEQNRGGERATQLSSSASQVYPENLVTSGRTHIRMSELEPMVVRVLQSMAYETSPGATQSRSRDVNSNTSSSGQSQIASNREGRSLSEVDIQARFMGFFQSRIDSHRPSSRGFRRPLRGRGGYRGPVPYDFYVHNPNNTPPVHPPTAGGQQTPLNREEEPHYRAEHVHYLPGRQTARRSQACTLLNRVLSGRSVTQGQQQQQQQRQHQRSRRPRRDKMHHGESLLSLLLRIHAKYSQRARSYEFNETRALANIHSKRNRIGDGVHFVTIVLDLICTLDREMVPRIEQLAALIWCDKEDQGSDLKWSHEKSNIESEGIGQSSRAECSMSSNLKTTKPLNVPSSSTSQSPFWSASSQGAASSSSSLIEGASGNSGTIETSIGGSPGTSKASSTELTAAARRQRAKEFQSKLMANFASKQKAFLEKYESLSQQQATAHYNANKGDKIGENRSSSSGALDEEPINLSSKLSYKNEEIKPQMSECDMEKQKLINVDDKSSDYKDAIPDASVTDPAAQQPGPSSNSLPVYECCICGVEGPSDLANPLGQVVLLQSTSIYGHSHMKPQSERRLPCEELDYTNLREETYAKYLERRIDLLCEHFSESSWLDSINIGAEGGVHVQSCGHYLHIECHQSYIKSLDQEDRLRSRNDSDEFLCPVCRQLANSVLPILSDIRQPSQLSLALVSSQNLDDQIKLISSLLDHRPLPNQEELRSSSSFCSHLTKATGPQYRLVRSNASMHSLFLFLTSIARTNLETEIIVRSLRPSTATNTFSQQQKCHYQHHQQHQHQSNTGGNSTSASKRSCFKLLFYVLALNAQTLINDQWFTCDQIWSYLTNRIDEKNRLSVKPMNSEVPLLLRDPTAMLLQFLFAITNSVSYRANFTCLVQVLFNLTVIQSVALALSYEKPPFLPRGRPSTTTAMVVETENESPTSEEKGEHASKREKGKKVGSLDGGGSGNVDDTYKAVVETAANDFPDLMALVGQNLEHLLATTHPLMNSSARYRFCLSRFTRINRCDGKDGHSSDETASDVSSGGSIGDSNGCRSNDEQIALIENRVKLACLPFLRAAALIQHHLYDEPYPDLYIVNGELLTNYEAIEVDFSTLTTRLNLGEINDDKKLIRSIKWPSVNEGKQLIVNWCADLLRFGAEFPIAAHTLLVGRSLAWYRPSLMQLPRSFDDIFMFYYRKRCSLCNQIPKDVAICLVCGAPICFRVSCCKDRSRTRQVHSQHCGANTAVFLAVHTSSIVVIRGNRACVWGSVYLDAHDEEDNGLQRGKPLYLVQARYELLEEQWLTHSFDHTCGKRWVYLHENQ